MNNNENTEEDDVYYIRFKEIQANYDRIEKLNSKLVSEQEVNTQLCNKYNETLIRLNEQIKQYDYKIEKNRNLKKKKNEDNFSSEISEDLLETDQHKLINRNKEDDTCYLNNFNQVLTNINTNLMINNFRLDQDCISEISGAVCNSIMVLINFRMELYLQSQFFRIDRETTFTKIREASLKLWNLDKEISKDFYFYFVDSNNNLLIIKNEEEETTIDNYIKRMNNVKKSIFLLLKKEEEYKVSPDVLNLFLKSDTKEEKKNDTNGQINELVKGFYQTFVGLTTHMVNKTQKLLIKLNYQDSIKLKGNENNNWKVVYFMNFFTFSLYLLFMLFTVFSLVKSNNPNKDFFINKSLTKLLSLKHNYISFNNMDSITLDLFYKLQPIFQTFSNKSDAFDGNYLITNIRMSFFRVKNNSCPTFVKNVSWLFCIHDYFNQDNLELDDNILSQVDIFNDKYIDQDIEKFQLYDDNLTLITANKTKKELKSIFNQTVFNYFKDMTFLKSSNQIIQNNYYSVNGRLGIYSTNGYNIYLDTMNDIAFKYILYIIQNSNLWDSGLRALITTFTIYNINFNKYVYVKIIYEISGDGYVLQNSVNIVPFEMNVYFGKEGFSIYIYDIIRLILVIYFILLVFQVVIEVKPGIDGKVNLTNYIVLLLQPKVILNLTISILFIVIFTTKNGLLSNSIDVFKPEIRFSQVDYYNISSNFKNVFLFENILIFALVFRILLFFTDFKRIRIFSHLLINVIKRVYFIFLNIAFLYLGFVIVANNLHGVYSDDYSDIPSSIRIILMISVGFPSKTYNTIMEEFSFIFIYIIYMFVVYFLLNILIGAYVEVSRITALIKGHVVDFKEIKLLEKETLKRKNEELKKFLNKDGLSIVS